MVTPTKITRPTSLDEIVGMEQNKRLIHYDMEGSLKLNSPPPSYIICGPAGTGKTTLAQVIAHYSGGEIYKIMGSNIKDPSDFRSLAHSATDNDIIFIEEAHTIGGGTKKAKYCQAFLLTWLEDFEIYSEQGTENAPHVCFVLATTNPGKLSPPLRTRCKILHTSYYTLEEIKEILLRAAIKLNLDLSVDDEALTLLAQCSRGSPRIALMHRLDNLRKLMSVDNLTFSVDTMERFFHVFKVDKWGLENSDLVYCNILYDKMRHNNGNGVSQKIMIQATGFAIDMLEDMVEGYLHKIGAISIDTKGRRLTQLGFEIIGKKPIIKNGVLFMKKESKPINNDELKILLHDKELLSGGMKGLSEKLGLRYPQDNSRLKTALEQLGYTSKQRVGITKL